MLLNAFLPLPVFNPALHIVTVSPSAAALSTVGTIKYVTSETSANQPVVLGETRSSAVKKSMVFLSALFCYLHQKQKTLQCFVSVDCKLGDWTSWSKSCSCDGRFLSRSKSEQAKKSTNLYQVEEWTGG